MWALQKESPAHTRCVEYIVQDSQGPYRLETKSDYLHQDQANLWTPGGGPVCIQADPPAAMLLQLETRSPSRNDRCLSAGLVSPSRVCQPTLVPYGESSESSDGARSP